MAKENLLPRGFKSKAEKISVAFRNELSLKPEDALCGFKLANYLGIEVYTPEDIFPVGTNITPLVGIKNDDGAWSALTMKTAKGNTIVIHNHLHAPTRQQSNLMHELAHVICKHERSSDYDGITLPFFMREFNKQQEEEANHLGSVLQIPRIGLVWALKKRMEIAEIAEYYNASQAMVTLRINTTGVKKQLKYLGH